MQSGALMDDRFLNEIDALASSSLSLSLFSLLFWDRARLLYCRHFGLCSFGQRVSNFHGTSISYRGGGRIFPRASLHLLTLLPERESLRFLPSFAFVLARSLHLPSPFWRLIAFFVLPSPPLLLLSCAPSGVSRSDAIIDTKGFLYRGRRNNIGSRLARATQARLIARNFRLAAALEYSNKCREFGIYILYGI